MVLFSLLHLYYRAVAMEAAAAAMLVLLVVLFGTMMVGTDKNRPTTIPVCFNMQ